jgi:hypothetical protein
MTWTSEPWEIYRQLQVAIGQFDGNQLELFVADARTLRARYGDTLGGQAYSTLEKAELAARYYSPPPVSAGPE